VIRCAGNINQNKIMPRKKTVIDTIQHKLYRNAYLKRRGDVIYIHIHHEGKEIRRTTNLTWHPNNFVLALAILERKYLNIIMPGEESHNLKDIFENFLVLKSKSITPGAVDKYRQAWKNFIQKDYTTVQMSELSRDIVRLLSNSHLSNNTAIKQLDQLDAFFRYCVEGKYIDSSPIVKSIYPKGTKLIAKAYTLDEIEMLQNSFEIGSDTYNLIKLIKNTGMRVAEAVNLKKNNIFDNYIVINGKGSIDRNFPVYQGTELYELLQVLKSKDKPFNFKSAKRAGDALFSLQKKLGMTLTGYHPIRKYFENKLIDSGMNVKATAQLLGHTTAVQSQNYITALSDAELRKTLENFI
jgi:site-specific recombinase XerD